MLVVWSSAAAMLADNIPLVCCWMGACAAVTHTHNPSLLRLLTLLMLLPLRATGLPLAAALAAAGAVGAPADMPSQESHPLNKLLAMTTAAAAKC